VEKLSTNSFSALINVNDIRSNAQLSTYYSSFSRLSRVLSLLLIEIVANRYEKLRRFVVDFDVVRKRVLFVRRVFRNKIILFLFVDNVEKSSAIFCKVNMRVTFTGTVLFGRNNNVNFIGIYPGNELLTRFTCT